MDLRHLRTLVIVNAATMFAAFMLPAAVVAKGIEPIRIESGLVQGTLEDGLTIYRGIPFAAPPLGELRWRAPHPPAKWQGVRAATEFGRACMQSNAAIAN